MMSPPASPSKHKKREPIHAEMSSTSVTGKSCAACRGRHRPHTCGVKGKSTGSGSTKKKGTHVVKV